MSIDIREKARAYILDDANENDPVSIGEFIMGDVDIDEVGEQAYDALVAQIGELIRHAQVTVTLPGDPVCPACGGTGQPADDSESDGTPKDLPQYEAVLDAIDTWLDNEDDSDGLATTIMGLLGAARAESEAAK